MSHEIRTPLNGIIGLVELLESQRLDREGQELIEMAHHSASSLMTIVDDVLDFSKIEAGKLELEAIAFRPGELCGEVAELLSEAASCRGPPLIPAHGLSATQAAPRLKGRAHLCTRSTPAEQTERRRPRVAVQNTQPVRS